MTQYPRDKRGSWPVRMRRVLATVGAFTLAATSAVAVTTATAAPEEPEFKPLGVTLETSASDLEFTEDGEVRPVSMSVHNPNDTMEAAIAMHSSTMGSILADGTILDGGKEFPGDLNAAFLRIAPGNTHKVTYNVTIPEGTEKLAGLDELFSIKVRLCPVGDERCKGMPDLWEEPPWVGMTHAGTHVFMKKVDGQSMNVTEASFLHKAFMRADQELELRTQVLNPTGADRDIAIIAGAGDGEQTTAVTIKASSSTAANTTFYRTTAEDVANGKKAADGVVVKVPVRVEDLGVDETDPHRVIFTTEIPLTYHQQEPTLSAFNPPLKDAYRTVGETIAFQPMVDNHTGTFLKNLKISYKGTDACPQLLPDSIYGYGRLYGDDDKIECGRLAVDQDMIRTGKVTLDLKADEFRHSWGAEAPTPKVFTGTADLEQKKAPTTLEVTATADRDTFRLPRETISAVPKVKNTGDADAWVLVGETVDGETPTELGYVAVGGEKTTPTVTTVVTGDDVTRGYVEVAGPKATDSGSADTKSTVTPAKVKLDPPMEMVGTHVPRDNVEVGDVIGLELEVTNDVDVDLVDGVVTSDTAEVFEKKPFTLKPGEKRIFAAQVEVTQAHLEAGEFAADFAVTATPDFPEPAAGAAAAMTRVNGAADATAPAARATADTFTLKSDPVVVPVVAKPVPNPSSGSNSGTTSKGSTAKTGAQIAGVGLLSIAAIALGARMVSANRTAGGRHSA